MISPLRAIVFLFCVFTLVHSQCFDAPSGGFTSFYTTSASSLSFGQSVALAGNGSTLVIGDPSNNQVFINLKNSTGYQLQQKITSTSYTNFGNSVAISADGLTLVIGASQDSITFSSQGVAYLYQRNFTSEPFQSGGFFMPTAPFSYQYYGYSVAVSDNGEMIAVGSSTGLACVYTSTRQLVGCATGSGTFGSAVALNGDGSTLIIGSYTFNSNKGEAYYYSVSSNSATNSVTLQQPLLPVNTTDQYYGRALAISSDGSTLVVTASNVAYWYKKQGSQYVYQGALKPSSAVSYYNLFGIAVSMSGNGQIVAISDTYEKEVYLFKLPSGVMQQQISAPANYATTSNYNFGVSISIADDESMIAIGATDSYSYLSGVYLYKSPPLPPTNNTSQHILLGTSIVGLTNNTRYYSTPSANVTALIFSVIAPEVNSTCLYVATGYQPTANHYDRMNCTEKLGFLTIPYGTYGLEAGKAVYSYIGGPVGKQFLFNSGVAGFN